MTASNSNIQQNLEWFLPTVGEDVLDFWRKCKARPDFAEMKANKNLRTGGDTLSEEKIRNWIGQFFPEDSIRGEELKAKIGTSARTWIVDPIDGTINYVELCSKFSVSVGLVENNVPKIGVLCFPAEKIIISASEGNGAHIINYQTNPFSNHTIDFSLYKDPESLDGTFINGVDLKLHAAYFADPKFNVARQQQEKLHVQHSSIEGVASSFTYTFLEFVNGHMDAITHLGATPYDIGAMCCIAKELGLPFSGYDGEPIDFSKDTIPIVISKMPKLHKQIIKVLSNSHRSLNHGASKS